MGLDMFLYRANKYSDNISAKELSNINSYLEWNNGYSTKCSLQEYCEVSEDDLNIGLVNKYGKDFVTRYSELDKEKKYGWNSIFEEIAYWRKANSIHKWLVDSVQGGTDDCGYYEVTKDKLEELFKTCNKVLDNSKLISGNVKNGEEYKDGKLRAIIEQGMVVEDSTVAEQLLPCSYGFFFGSVEYDQWYIDDIKYTADVIEKALKETDFENQMIIYSSSW